MSNFSFVQKHKKASLSLSCHRKFVDIILPNIRMLTMLSKTYITTIDTVFILALTSRLIKISNIPLLNTYARQLPVLYEIIFEIVFSF